MKRIALRFLIILIIIIMLSLLIVSYKVNASNFTDSEVKQPSSTLNLFNGNILIDSDEKIMKYDARTKETTIVDMNELKKVVNTKMCYSDLNSNAIVIPPFNTSNNLNTNSVITTKGSLPDSAEMVSNTNSYPNNQICRLEYQNSKNQTCYGSAAIVGGPRIAITAAHCVFDINDGKAIFKNWKIQPGYSNGSTTGTETGWDVVYYSNEWMNSSGNNIMYDWAICVLQADTKCSGLGAVANMSNSELNNLSVTAYGYPADGNYGYLPFASYQYRTGEKIRKIYDTYFEYDAYTVGGFSGGPVLRDSDNYIVGIHSKGEVAGGTSYAVKLTAEMANIILSLI